MAIRAIINSKGIVLLHMVIFCLHSVPKLVISGGFLDFIDFVVVGIIIHLDVVRFLLMVFVV